MIDIKQYFSVFKIEKFPIFSWYFEVKENKINYKFGGNFFLAKTAFQVF